MNTFPPDASRPVLDVGGGNGYVSLGLERAGIDVILVEPGESGARNAKQRGLEHVICATASEANFRPGSIGGIGLFDVIEHVEDDHGFLDRLSSHLVRNDRLYATVPAYQALWSDEDVKAGHQRRYDARTATALLEATGFEVDFASYFFRPLPVPVLLFRTLPSRLRGRRPPSAETEAVPSTPDDVEPEPSAAPARSHAANAGTLSRAVRRLLRSEIANIESGRPMRFGGSMILAAHRR